MFKTDTGLSYVVLGTLVKFRSPHCKFTAEPNFVSSEVHLLFSKEASEGGFSVTVQRKNTPNNTVVPTKFIPRCLIVLNLKQHYFTELIPFLRILTRLHLCKLVCYAYFNWKFDTASCYRNVFWIWKLVQVMKNLYSYLVWFHMVMFSVIKLNIYLFLFQVHHEHLRGHWW